MIEAQAQSLLQVLLQLKSTTVKVNFLEYHLPIHMDKFPCTDIDHDFECFWYFFRYSLTYAMLSSFM